MQSLARKTQDTIAQRSHASGHLHPGVTGRPDRLYNRRQSRRRRRRASPRARYGHRSVNRDADCRRFFLRTPSTYGHQKANVVLKKLAEACATACAEWTSWGSYAESEEFHHPYAGNVKDLATKNCAQSSTFPWRRAFSRQPRRMTFGAKNNQPGHCHISARHRRSLTRSQRRPGLYRAKQLGRKPDDGRRRPCRGTIPSPPVVDPPLTD